MANILPEKKVESQIKRENEFEILSGPTAVCSGVKQVDAHKGFVKAENVKTIPEIQYKLKIKCVHPNRDTTQHSNALVWNSSQNVEVKDVGLPLLTEPGDAIIRLTTIAVCGSDLHMYANEVPGPAMEKGDILGHEGVGYVEAVGSEVKNFQKGDRVVISAVIACGECEYCQKKQTSMCENTNPSKEMQALYGARLAGIFGYTHLTGAYDGLQAEHARVPLADINLHKIPDDVADESAVFLSDVCCTAWHGLELAEVDRNTKSLAIWGAGPIGLVMAHLAKYRGASRVVVIDHHDERLERARYAGAEVINFEKQNVCETLRSWFPDGVEKCVDCVGYRTPQSLAHRISRQLKLETDSPEVIQEIVMCCKKGGNIALIGDYFGAANNFPIGAMMEKGFTVRGGQLWVHKYWDHLMELIQKKEIDPTFVISHRLDFNKDGADAYRMFYKREDGAIKIILKTRFYNQELAKKSTFSLAPKTTWSNK